MSYVSDLSQSSEYLSFRSSIPLRKVAVDSDGSKVKVTYHFLQGFPIRVNPKSFTWPNQIHQSQLFSMPSASLFYTFSLSLISSPCLDYILAFTDMANFRLWSKVCRLPLDMPAPSLWHGRHILPSSNGTSIQGRAGYCSGASSILEYEGVV